MELYEKHVSKGGKVTYVLHVPQQPEPVVAVKEETIELPVVPLCSEFTNGELVTWTASLIMYQIIILNRLLPEHTKIARSGKLQAVENALIELVQGLGEPLDDTLIEYISKTWNLAMSIMQNELTDEYEKHMGKAAATAEKYASEGKQEAP